MSKHLSHPGTTEDDCYGQSRIPENAVNGSEDRTGRAKADQESGKEQGYRVLSYLLAGIIVYGAVGWLLDRWLDTDFLLPVGVIVGAACSIYLIIRRYGGQSAAGAGPKSTGKEGSTSWEKRPSA